MPLLDSNSTADIQGTPRVAPSYMQLNDNILKITSAKWLFNSSGKIVQHIQLFSLFIDTVQF